MSYLVLARKWRPQRFEDLQGQESITRILQNAVKQSKIAHAYLFSGPRGVGKTSTARILAKALNCIDGPTVTPCGKCPFCTAIADGSSVDVIEIDGASNNSVDDIRDLREKVKYAPSGGRYKIYIIDEAHMLSQSAFNALLKTLEEPPPHVVFVLATTAPNKVPITVLSRCQHLPLKRIPSRIIRERLRLITDEEKIKITERAMDLLSRAADGSMRDSLTLLDQISAFSDEIREEDLAALLGISDSALVIDMIRAVLAGDRESIIELSEQLYEKGQDIKDFLKSLISLLRDLLVCKVLNKVEGVLDLNDEDRSRVDEIFSIASEEQLTLFLEAMVQSENEIRISGFPRVAMEMSLIKASFLSRFREIGEILRKIQSGNPQPGSAPEAVSLKRAEAPKPARKIMKKADDPVVSPPVSDERPTLMPEKTDTDGLWPAIVSKTDEQDHVLAPSLAQASAEVKEDTIILTFTNEFQAKNVMSKKKLIEEIAAGIAGKKMKVVLETKKKPVEDIREKIMNDPMVRETLELFDGRIIDIKQRNNES